MVDPSHIHDYRVDIWSIGVLIFELCTGSSPFSSELALSNKITEAAVKANITSLNYRLPHDLSIPCKDLISKILVLEPAQRPSLDSILAHPWLTKVVGRSAEEARERWVSRLKH
jgi:serine/threonine protein kinase